MKTFNFKNNLFSDRLAFGELIHELDNSHNLNVKAI